MVNLLLHKLVFLVHRHNILAEKSEDLKPYPCSSHWAKINQHLSLCPLDKKPYTGSCDHKLINTFTKLYNIQHINCSQFLYEVLRNIEQEFKP